MSQQKSLGDSLENAVVEKARKAGKTAKKQPYSGATLKAQGDVVVNSTLVECKVRAPEIVAGEKSFRFQLEWFDKVRIQAAAQGYERGVVVIRQKHSGKMMVLLDFDEFLEML